ncbi:MAG TPA: polysaccharide deacetylase family protein [Melioribacteraceae bacterium]|nr:polysaccharide deacetylase family protein [Melioribacteraceae bacterium]
MTKINEILFPNAFWSTKNNKILLTIDDSPTKKGTEKILKILNNNKIKALFFINGTEAIKYQNLINEIFSEGHSIGNHSFNHKSLLFKSKKLIKYEILKTDEIITKTLNIAPKYFRPPYGRFNFYSKIINILNKRIVMWDVFTYDYKNNPKIIKFAIRKCKTNSIIVMHDNIKTENYIEHNYGLVIDYLLNNSFNIGEADECLS